MSEIVLPLLYLPNISFFQTLKKHSQSVVIEQFENYPKQTLRNRAQIYSPNGILDISIPVNKGTRIHTFYKDITISYDFNWQRIHWQTLETCYRSSAYFEFYEDDFHTFYHQKIKFLYDFNQQLLHLILQKLKLNFNLNFTEEYFPSNKYIIDARGNFYPKNAQTYSVSKYYQVFEDRHGFIANLSIVDLLFNQGPQASLYF